ncbi:MAG TPA: S9 family peptidase, partial [Gemmatimonadales bacterium]|nr:S9 family peptidase [Gemmatimonadales bacterium]
MTRPASLFLVLLAATAVQLPAQTADSSLLTVDRIYGSTEFRPESFGPARWLSGGTAYTTLEPSAETKGGKDIVRYDAATGARTVLVAAARLVPAGATAPLEVEDYTWSDDEKQLLVFTNSKPVWRTNTRGDYWALDLATWKLRKLGGDAAPSTLMFAKFAPDGRRVGYVRDFNLYVEDLDSGTLTQLTKDGSRVTINGTFDWVYEEELGLKDGWRWSPDGKNIAFWQLVADSVRNFALINYTDSLYPVVTEVQYPKAGESNSAARVGIIPSTGGSITWLQLPGDPRNYYPARMEWAASSEQVSVQQLNRLQNADVVFLGDRSTGAVHPVLTERDSAWVDVVNDMVWLDGGKSFTWVSERDGWKHVYVVSRDGATTRLITPGNFDVADVATVDEKGGWVYYIASPDNPAQRYLYRTRLDGKGTAQRVTPAGQSGSHAYNIGAGARFAMHNWSSFGVPGSTDLVRLPDHAVLRPLAANTALKAKIASLKHGTAEFFKVDIGDGISLNGWIMKPPGFDASRKYPILFTVYGGPGSQTVLDSWGGANYLWHLMLTQQGYLVASVDNRGTGMRGRDWKKIIYGQLGVIETHDQAAAAKAIGRWNYVDSTRIGIWGWSYGGFMTLNTLFHANNVYSMGMAVAPVTQWRFYDNVYTERYNGLPKDNAAGYDKGSPLSYVDSLKGKLLLVHGSGDDNVHYQNSQSLINALVKADKPFEMMEYPN